MLYQKELPLRYTTDILVVGGGPSGVAAAVLACESQDIRKVDISLLKREIVKSGGIIPDME